MIYQYKIDNKIFFNPNNFEIFNELKLNIQIITEEAKYILENSPKLDMCRSYDEWESQKLLNEYGWFRSWKHNDKNGNYDWLMFGILFYGNEFNKNILYCPKTFDILKKFKDKINVAGFSLLKANSKIEKHNDDIGVKYNSLASHLGLIIPQQNSTCQIIINDGNNNYSYIEKSGEILVFDSTYEHYAFNNSLEDRVILYIDFKLK